MVVETLFFLDTDLGLPYDFVIGGVLWYHHSPKVYLQFINVARYTSSALN